MSAINVQEARKQAGKLSATIKLGQNPAQEKLANRTRALETLGAIMPAASRSRRSACGRARSRKSAGIFWSTSNPCAGLPIAAVERRTVAGRLATIGRVSGAAQPPTVSASSSAAFFAWAIGEGFVDDSPVAWIKRREEQPPQPRPVRRQAQRDVDGAARRAPTSRIVKLLVLTGARREEIGARCGGAEVDLDAGADRAPARADQEQAAHTPSSCPMPPSRS